jgi:hypothetical protein
MTADIGHNSGQKQTIRDRLEALYTRVINRFKELTETADEVPAVIADETTATNVSDLVKLMKVAVKEADGARKIEKEPYLSAGQQVDAFFKTPCEQIEAKAADLQRRLTLYLQEKEAAERRRREEEAVAARERAQRLFDEAAQRDEERIAAEKLAEEQRAKANAARADKETAINEVRNFTQIIDIAKRELRDAKATQNVEAMKLANTKLLTATEQKAAMQERVDEFRAEERAAAEEAAAKAREAKTIARDVKEQIGSSERQERMADKLDNKAQAGSSELGRTRGGLGSMASLTQRWAIEDIQRHSLDLEALRDHLPIGALETAVRSWIDANKDGLRDGKAKLRGATIGLDTSAVVR